MWNSFKYHLILSLIFFLAFSAAGQSRKNIDNIGRSQPKTAVHDNGLFDVNRIYNDFENNGMITSHRISGHSGLEWPKYMGTHAMYACGLWLADSSSGRIRTAVAEFASDYTPGPYSDYFDTSAVRVYKISKSDLNNPGLHNDIVEWPVGHGAPWVDANNDGFYNPDDGDLPDLLGDKMYWYVCNDRDTSSRAVFKSESMHIEQQVTMWGYDGMYNGTDLRDVMFVKSLFINKGVYPIENAYLGFWADPDLGDAGDDFVGCDTTLDLGFCYNDGVDLEYGSATPSIGSVILQGPKVPSAGDRARMFSRIINDEKNYSMELFPKYLKSPGGGFTWSETSSSLETYWRLKGLSKSGTEMINPVSGSITRFAWTGEPDHNADENDSVWVFSDDYSAHDARFLMSSGPFEITPGDSQEVIYAIYLGQGTDAINSIAVLKSIAPSLKEMAGHFFNVEITPAPALGLELSDVKILGDHINDDRVINNGEVVKFQIEMQNLTENHYQNVVARLSHSLSRRFSNSPLFDIAEIPANSIYTFGDHVFQLGVPKDFSDDSIYIRLSIYDIDSQNSNLSEFALPVFELDFMPELGGYFETDAGTGDARLGFYYVEPAAVTGDSYHVEIQPYFLNDGLIPVDTAIGLSLFNITTGLTLLDHHHLPDEYGFDYPRTEGFKLFMDNIPEDLKSVSVVANAGGPIEHALDGLAWWYFGSYLVADGTYDGQQVTNESIWMLNVGPMYGHAEGGVVDEDDFIGAVFSYSGGYGASSHGLRALVPDDFEIRFTFEGQAINYWADESLIELPFEVWNIGIATDPGDDYKLIVYLLDEDGNGVFNLMYDASDTTSDTGWADHGTSGALNDPWTDRFYVLAPVDDTPGTQGYDNFVTAVEFGGNLPDWYSGPGDNDPGGPLDAWNVFSRLVFMNWNGGDVTTATSPADYNAEMPEAGTVFRITTSKPAAPGDIFSFRTNKSDIFIIPRKFALKPNFPNPFNNYTNISFDIPERADVRFQIFDILGRQVKSFQKYGLWRGEHTLQWNGKDQFGKKLPTGVYFVFMQSGSFTDVRKMLLLK